jgi:hypothetical protein
MNNDEIVEKVPASIFCAKRWLPSQFYPSILPDHSASWYHPVSGMKVGIVTPRKSCASPRTCAR